MALIRDVLRRWWGLELAFADAKGYVLDHADGKIFPSQNELCRLALFSKEGFRRCNDSIKVVRDRLRGVKKRNVIVHECHLGFDVVAAPIHADGRLMGFVFTGGSLHEEPTQTAKIDLSSREVHIEANFSQLEFLYTEKQHTPPPLSTRR